MAQANPNPGATTGPAAVPATAQGPAPTTAAPETEPARQTAPAGPAPRRQFAPRRTMNSDMTAPAGLSQMLSAVSNFGWRTHSGLRQPNYVVPNTTMFFQVLGLCDTQMAHTKRFTDANPDWHPFVSQLYFSILIYYQVLKNQQVGNQISNDQRLFLEFLENQFNIAHAKIPGPLVPFFQSLAACSGPTERYGNVTYGIPNNLDANQQQHFLAKSRFNMHLPSIILILDQLMRLVQYLAPVNGTPPVVALSATDYHYTDIFGTAAANTAANRVCMKTPTARVNPTVSVSGMSGFAAAADLWRNVLPFAADGESSYRTGDNEDLLSFDQYLGFRGIGNLQTTNYNWFAEVGRIMQPYADFFRDSAALGAISTTGIGAIFVTSTYVNDARNSFLVSSPVIRRVRYQTAATNRYDIPAATDLTIDYHNTDDGLDLVAKQLAILTNFNTVWEINEIADHPFPGPEAADIISGPVWNLPNLESTGNIQPILFYGNLISGYYHTPTAGRFGA